MGDTEKERERKKREKNIFHLTLQMAALVGAGPSLSLELSLGLSWECLGPRAGAIFLLPAWAYSQGVGSEKQSWEASILDSS